MMNLANILTLARLAILPFIIVLLFLPDGWAWAAWACLTLYVVGSLTDYVDGWVARRYNQITDFGKFLDPIADKIYVVTILLMLIAVDRITGVFVLAVVVILMREFTVSGLREFLGPKDVKLPVTQLAKWKTATQMVATGLLIITPVTPVYISWTGLLLLCVAAALTVITGWNYVKAGLKHIF